MSLSFGEFFSIDFLSSMSIIGWFGVLLMLVIPIAIVITYNDEYKNMWFMDFEERMPRLDFVTELVGDLGEGAEIGWLVVRLILMEIVFVGIGLLLMVISAG